LPEKIKTLLSEKINALRSKKAKTHENSLNYLRVDPGPECLKKKIEIIKKSIKAERKMLISYSARGGKTTNRHVEPHCLLLRKGIWYLYAYCCIRQTFRMFRVSRIIHIEVTGERFIRRSFSFDTDYALEPFYERARLAEIVFTCEVSTRSMLEDWIDPSNITPCGENLLVRTLEPHDGYLINQLLSLNCRVKILSPEHIKREVSGAADRIINLYKKDDATAPPSYLLI
jgi:predicted DNA-binding transcriptional regulator YafY